MLLGLSKSLLLKEQDVLRGIIDIFNAKNAKRWNAVKKSRGTDIIEALRQTPSALPGECINLTVDCMHHFKWSLETTRQTEGRTMMREANA